MSTTKNMPKQTSKNEEVKNYYASKQPNFIYNKNNHYYKALMEFEKYLEKNYAEGTLYNIKRHAIRIFLYLEQKEILNLSEINVDIINEYLNSFPKYYSKHTIKDTYKNIKLIIRYFYKFHLISTDLSIFVPSIKVSRFSTIPSVWSEEEIKLTFKQIKLDSKSGKRLYLVLLLAIKFGLRYVDIINLKFDDIDWKNKIIKVKQHKTGKETYFPLTKDVVSALIDYIKNARPESKEKFIILKNNGEMIKGHIFYYQTNQLIKKSGIDYKNKKRGIHSMRHTLASTLLNKNIPLPIISKVLEHSSKDITLIYSKVDETRLRKCCLSLKEVKTYE